MADLVVDASVARSCGDLTSTKSPAPECRDFLLAMQEHKHKIVMTKDIKAEWDKHQSRFATQWLSQMVGRKLLQAIPTPEIDQEIWKPIEDMAATDKERKAMVKDILLLEAALATDQRIVSLDENNVQPLDNLKYLTILDLSNNQVENIQPLANLNGLNYLNLDCNQITDLKSLAGLNSLDYLYINTNPINIKACPLKITSVCKF